MVITAPGPGSGKMATCLSQLYHDNRRGIPAGYAKYETFPIWNLPLKHPVNLAYEAATADLNDVNMIDPFHLEAYGVTTVNYNRDVEIFPVLAAMFKKIQGECPYKSPTDMGVNMAGFAIVDDDVCQEASRMEILRRYYAGCVERAKGQADECVVRKLELVMQQADVTPELCPAVAAALEKAEATGKPAGAMVLPDGCVVTGKTSPPAGRVGGAAAQRPEAHGGHRPQAGADPRLRHRAHQRHEDRVSGTPQPPPPLRRGADRAGDLRADQSAGGHGAGAAENAAGLRRPLLRHHFGGGRQAV